MNRFYRYPNFELWNSAFWRDHLGAADPLLQWIQSHNTAHSGDFVPPQWDDLSAHPYYRRKTKCIDLPEIREEWANRGLRYTSLEQGQKLWISIVPMERENRDRLPALIVPVHQDYSDPWWAMKTMSGQRRILDLAARMQNLIVLFLVTQGCDTDRIYNGILQEAVVLYRIDPTQMLLDVSVPLEKGVMLSSIPDFRWIDEKGNPLNPDTAVALFSEEKIPVLNIGGRWGSRDSLSRGLVMEYAMNNGTFDRDRFIHSMVGRQTMEGIVLEYQHNTAMCEGLVGYWRSVGLDAAEHETQGERWLVLSPRQIDRDLPLMIIMQEVDRGNEHVAVTTMGTYHAFTQIAAEGECILLFFALEHPDDNDLLAQLIDEAACLYPIDKTRVYITGHSHNGYFALHFAIRHPDKITAVATLGNPTALEPPEERGEPVLAYSDEQLERLRQVDMPLINLCGYCEFAGRVPQESVEYTRWVKNIRRRFYACRCPVPTEQEIRRVKGCDDTPQRKLGIPASHSETVWHDGVEHYVIDIKNIDGRNHLRMVSSENMPHMVTPFMQEMAWSFLRRFARNPKTGEIIDRY